MKAKHLLTLFLLSFGSEMINASPIEVTAPGILNLANETMHPQRANALSDGFKARGRKITQTLVGHGDIVPISLSWYSTKDLVASENFFDGNVVESFAATLPKDVEFMVACFASDDRYYFVIRDNVTATELDEYVLDAEEAVNQVDFKLVMPDGTEPDFQVWQCKNGEYVLYEDGRIEQMDLTASIRTPRFKDLEIGGLWGFFRAAVNPDGEYESPLKMFNFYINDVADDFYFLHIYNAACKDYTLAAVLEGSLGEEMPYTNSPQDYYGIETTVNTPAIYDEFEHYPASYVYQIIDGNIVGFMGPVSQSFKPTYKIVSNTDDERQIFFVGYAENVMGDDGVDYPLQNFYRMQPIAKTPSQPGLLNYAGLSLPFGGPYAYLTDGEWTGGSWIKFNNIGSLPLNQETLTYGNDCPITVFVPRTDSEDMSFTPSLSVSYIGRNGDYRGSNSPFTSILLMQDGEVLADGVSGLQQWCYYNKERLYEESFDIVTDNTIANVDDLKSRNSAQMHFAQGMTPPTLQLLQFRNGAGVLTDRFEAAEDAKVELMGGAFDYYFANGEWFEYADREIEWKVEYAPYGTDDFTSLDIEKDEKIDPIHGYGDLYYGSLDAVDQKSLYGWFDMRITLTDSEGNYQTQIVSPAFCIESLAGIANNEVSTWDVRVVGNNIIAPEGTLIYNLAGIQCASEGLTPGIYFVKYGSAIAKVIVK